MLGTYGSYCAQELIKAAGTILIDGLCTVWENTAIRIETKVASISKQLYLQCYILEVTLWQIEENQLELHSVISAVIGSNLKI